MLKLCRPAGDDKAPLGSHTNLDDDRQAIVSGAMGGDSKQGKKSDDDEDTIGSSAGVTKSTLYDKDLMRILAETSFIYGEVGITRYRKKINFCFDFCDEVTDYLSSGCFFFD